MAQSEQANQALSRLDNLVNRLQGEGRNDEQLIQEIRHELPQIRDQLRQSYQNENNNRG